MKLPKIIGKYLGSILISIDQFGNTLAGGNPDNTISARIGYNAQNAPQSYRWYWKGLEKVVDTTFWPVDGPRHCLKAYQNDTDEVFKETKNNPLHIVLTIIIFASCLVLLPSLYILYSLGIVRPKDEGLDNIEKQLRIYAKRLNIINKKLEKATVINHKTNSYADDIIAITSKIKDTLSTKLDI